MKIRNWSVPGRLLYVPEVSAERVSNELVDSTFAKFGVTPTSAVILQFVKATHGCKGTGIIASTKLNAKRLIYAEVDAQQNSPVEPPMYELLKEIIKIFKPESLLAAPTIFNERNLRTVTQQFGVNFLKHEAKNPPKTEIGDSENTDSEIHFAIDEKMPFESGINIISKGVIITNIPIGSPKLRLMLKLFDPINAPKEDVFGIILFSFGGEVGIANEAKEINGLFWSEKFKSWYSYLRLESGSDLAIRPIALRVPAATRALGLTIRPWKSKSFTLTNSIGLDQLPNWQLDDFKIPKPEIDIRGPKVAAIADTFTYQSLSYDLNIFPVSCENWRDELEAQKFDLLLVESAWAGNDGKWRFAMTNPNGDACRELRSLVQECKRRNIKTLFYNKEDPPNYDIFIGTAKLFDMVVTSDVNCVEKYKTDCGHSNVFVMPFAAQPKIHNPIAKKELDDYEVAFAGTWYNNKHPERSELMPVLLDPATKYRFTIFDRQSGWTQDDSYEFPDRYKSFVKESVEYREMLSIHKMFKLFLNVNSVTESATMFSRRVFEILASSTPVLSTESSGIRAMFPDIVKVVTKKSDAEIFMARLLVDDCYRKKIGHLGHREVMLHHTVKSRLVQLFKEAKIPYKSDEQPRVSLAIPTNRPAHLKLIRENLVRQNYANLEAVVVLNSDEFDLAEAVKFFDDISWVKVIQLPASRTLGACLNASVEMSSGEYWAKMDDDNIYLENFVSDMMLPFLYSDAGIVAKGTYFAYLEATDQLILRFPGREHCWVDFASGSALFVRKSIFDHVSFPDISVGEDTKFLSACKDLGYRMYSPDCFNYVVVRRTDTSSHTWKASVEQVLSGSKIICDGLNLEYVRV